MGDAFLFLDKIKKKEKRKNPIEGAFPFIMRNGGYLYCVQKHLTLYLDKYIFWSGVKDESIFLYENAWSR